MKEVSIETLRWAIDKLPDPTEYWNNRYEVFIRPVLNVKDGQVEDCSVGANDRLLFVKIKDKWFLEL